MIDADNRQYDCDKCHDQGFYDGCCKEDGTECDCQKQQCGWVSVKDRLPKKSKRYVVIHGNELNAWNDDELGFSSFFAGSNEFAHDNVLYWFELPELPAPQKAESSDG